MSRTCSRTGARTAAYRSSAGTDLDHPTPARIVNDSCLASARRWQSEAQCLREQAETRSLTPTQKAGLLREAQAADRQATWWMGGIEHG